MKKITFSAFKISLIVICCCCCLSLFGQQPCDEASPNGSPGCSDDACEALVCAVDPFCCDVAWDALCAMEAEALCAPSCDPEVADPARMWPPNYSYRVFTIEDMLTSVSLDCSAWVHEASSDEAEDAPGFQDGNTLNDIVIAPDCQSVQVRQEKMGGGDGRVYTITMAIEDPDGGIAFVDFYATVPKWAWGWNSDAVNSGSVYAESGNCNFNIKNLTSPYSPMTSPRIAANELDLLLRESLSVHPNPFQQETSIEFPLSQAAFTTVEIFNLQGQFVQQLFSGKLDAGEHRMQWTAKDKSGQALSSGIYLVRLTAGERRMVKKVILKR